MSNPTPSRTLDLGPMTARLILALLTAATVVLLGLWLRASSALGLFATFVSVTASTFVAARLRGPRIGPPTAAAERLQPLVDALATIPGGTVVARMGFRQGAVAAGIGFAVAAAEQIVAAVLFESAVMAPLWRGVIALVVVMLPVNAVMAWLRSRQEYEGTRFASNLVDALRQVVSPGADPASSVLAGLPSNVRIALAAGGRTAAAVSGRIVVQLAIPAVFSTPLSIAFVVVLTITLIAGGPVFASMGRALRAPTQTTPAQTTPAGTREEDR